MNMRVSCEWPRKTASASWMAMLSARMRRSGVRNHVQPPVAQGDGARDGRSSAAPWPPPPWRLAGVGSVGGRRHRPA